MNNIYGCRYISGRIMRQSYQEMVICEYDDYLIYRSLLKGRGFPMTTVESEMLGIMAVYHDDIFGLIEMDILNMYPYTIMSLWDYVIQHGKMNIVYYLYENYPTDYLDEWSCRLAAEYGQYDCLVFLHEHGCRWNTWTCEIAARNGHIDILRYAHEQGCPWNEWTTIQALTMGQLNCIRYALDEGCPIDRAACIRQAYYPDRVRQWLTAYYSE